MIIMTMLLPNWIKIDKDNNVQVAWRTKTTRKQTKHYVTKYQKECLEDFFMTNDLKFLGKFLNYPNEKNIYSKLVVAEIL